MLLGASGRLAKTFISAAAASNLEIVPVARSAFIANAIRVESYNHIPSHAFSGVGCIVNCAGAISGSPLELDQANHRLPANVAKQGLEKGVKHFVQVSSFSVFGRAEHVQQNTPIAPVTAYGRSKAAGEGTLIRLTDQGLEPALLRVPIIYDAAAPTKLKMLAKLMSRLHWFAEPAPAPKRAMIHTDNCAALLLHIAQTGLSGPLFGADLEMFEIRQLADALRQAGRSVTITTVPAALLSPLAMAAPGLHASLFRSSILEPRDNLGYQTAMPRALKDGLAEIARTV